MAHARITGGQTLRSTKDTLDGLGVRIVSARERSVRGAPRRNGIPEHLGEDKLAPTVDRALEPGTPALR